MIYTLPVIALAIVGFAVFVAFVFRRVVSTNEVHIVQSAKKTVSYGKDTDNGNVYYEWPSFLPVIGVNKIVLPVSVFDLELKQFPAYDVGRVPFVIDIQAFFRISDSNLAASRISDFQELREQLTGILQGASRAMLASSEIEDIMQGRSAFGEAFTKEVEAQLENWGVHTVKNIELMDIRDAHDSNVIGNIMEKKKSLIEMESRSAVAENNKKAQIAEIDAQRDTNLRHQEALQQVGQRTAEKDQAVGIANEQAQQEIKEQARMTAEKEMAVVQVNDVKRAEINKQMGIVTAEEEKQKQILAAEAQLEAEKRKAEGISLVGHAEADAEKAKQLAPVEAQIVLAKEIGENKEYQTYLITVEQIKAQQVVGVEQAKALQVADVKLIANTGENVGNGISSIGELFSPKGGLNVASALEAFSNTPMGKQVLGKIVGGE